MARSLEGWLFPSRVCGAASSELAAWLGPEAEAFAVQPLLPLSLAGPLIPATKDPASLQMTWNPIQEAWDLPPG